VYPKRKDLFCSSVLPEIVRNRVLLATDASVSECQDDFMNLVATGLWPVVSALPFHTRQSAHRAVVTGSHF